MEPDPELALLVTVVMAPLLAVLVMTVAEAVADVLVLFKLVSIVVLFEASILSADPVKSVQLYDLAGLKLVTCRMISRDRRCRE